MAHSSPLTPRETLTARVRSWAGIRIAHDRGIGSILFKDRPIGRFPSNDGLEAVLCGRVGGSILHNTFDLPDGVWPTDDQRRVLIDLTTPAGIEEAIRVLLASYMAGRDPDSHDWYLRDPDLAADPRGEGAADIIERYRAARHAVAG